MSDFLKDIIRETGNEYASLVSDGSTGDVNDFIDTGSYIFNALLGGSIYRGLPSNKITAIAGESATGKTFFVLGMVKSFLDKNPDAGVIFFESESAITKELIEERDIDSSRMVVMPVTTVQEFRHQAITVLDKYIEQKELHQILSQLHRIVQQQHPPVAHTISQHPLAETQHGK